MQRAGRGGGWHSAPCPLLAAGALLVWILVAGPAPARAQRPDVGTGTRIGVSLGGVSTVGIVLERFHDTRSVEISVGTWSFRDVAASAVYKEYFGAGGVRPFVGGGLWAVAAFPSEGRTGLALVLRAPVGFDWDLAGDHALGAALGVNLALLVRRTDPEDDLPSNRRLVPLPEAYYRFRP